MMSDGLITLVILSVLLLALDLAFLEIYTHKSI